MEESVLMTRGGRKTDRQTRKYFTLFLLSALKVHFLFDDISEKHSGITLLPEKCQRNSIFIDLDSQFHDSLMEDKQRSKQSFKKVFVYPYLALLMESH